MYRDFASWTRSMANLAAPTPNAMDRQADNDSGDDSDQEESGEEREDKEPGAVRKGKGGVRVDGLGNTTAGNKSNAKKVAAGKFVLPGQRTLMSCIPGCVVSQQANKRPRSSTEATQDPEAASVEGIATDTAVPRSPVVPPMFGSTSLPLPLTNDFDLDSLIDGLGRETENNDTSTSTSSASASSSLPSLTSSGRARKERGPDIALLERFNAMALRLESLVSSIPLEREEALRSIDEDRSSALQDITSARDEAALKIDELHGLLKAHSQLDVLMSELTAVNREGRVICLLCTQNCACLADRRQLTSPFIASNGGLSQHNGLVRKWNDHVASRMHELCEECAQARAQSLLPVAMSKEVQRQQDVMVQLFRLAAFTAKHKLSFYLYEELVALLHTGGVDVGDVNHSRMTAREMNETIADFGRKQLTRFLKEKSCVTSHLPHVGVAADKLTDLGGKQSQMVMLRVNYNGTPLTFFATVVMLVAGLYDEDHEANGLSCFNEMCEAVEGFGVSLFEVKTKDQSGEVTEWGDALLVSGHGEQWRSTAADGEGVYNGTGPLKSVRARLVGSHGLGDKTHVMFWDQAHCFDLLVEDVYKNFPYITDIIHVVIKQIYTHFAQSPHQYRRLEKLVADWGAGDLLRKLHHLFEVRFVASEQVAVNNFLVDLPAIVAALKDELDEVGITSEKSAKLNGWLGKLLQVKFVGHLAVLVDIHTVSQIFSKEAQSDSNLVIDVPTFQDATKARFEKLMTSLGTEATRRLPSMQLGKLVFAEAGQPGRELTMTDDDSGVAEVVGVVKLRGVMGSMHTRLLSYQKAIVGPIIAGFDGRIQDKGVARDLREIFDFRRMPLELTEAAHSELMVWSESTIDRFLPLYFPECSLFDFKCEALTARLFVRENRERFMQLKDPDDATKGRVLVLTGSGSIFDALYSRSDVCSKPIPMFLHVADYMIAFMWQSCCGERAGSHINLTKTKGRTGLHDSTFDSLVFNTFNMPHLHEIDFASIVKDWSDNGHTMGTTKAGMEVHSSEPTSAASSSSSSSSSASASASSAPSSSKVVQRHMEKKAATFLFKKHTSQVIDA
jgi:hypothetical protein